MMADLGYKLPKNKPARWFVGTHVEGCSFLDDGTFALSNVGESGCNCIGESKDDFFIVTVRKLTLPSNKGSDTDCSEELDCR